MKLRDKDTKKYLLTVFVATFVAYIIPAVVLYLGHFMGFMLTICISLFNLSMALLAWLWAKSVRKEFLLKRQIILNSLVTLLLIGGENGAFPPTRNGCIHSLSMRERG